MLREGNYTQNYVINGDNDVENAFVDKTLNMTRYTSNQFGYFYETCANTGYDFYQLYYDRWSQFGTFADVLKAFSQNMLANTLEFNNQAALLGVYTVEEEEYWKVVGGFLYIGLKFEPLDEGSLLLEGSNKYSKYVDTLIMVLQAYGLDFEIKPITMGKKKLDKILKFTS